MCHEPPEMAAHYLQGVIVMLCPNGIILCKVMYQLAAHTLCHLPDKLSDKRSRLKLQLNASMDRAVNDDTILSETISISDCG